VDLTLTEFIGGDRDSMQAGGFVGAENECPDWSRESK